MNRSEMLFQQIMRARNRVYQVSGPAPMETYPLPEGGKLLVKREDLSPIHAYKWRGAYNMIAAQPEELLENGVITASAGNHAMGVALAASKLGCQAHIYMPVTVAKVKVNEVKRIGGDHVTVVITGDTYDAASQAARNAAIESGMLYVPAYDDPLVMAGQGTVGDEIMMHAEKPDVMFLQIGGGGLASSVACAIKSYAPETYIIGVEGEGQACMKAAIEAGHPVELPYVDVFCDGTAVKKAGTNTFPICAEFIDEFMTVSNDDVCAAVQRLWETVRTIAEPAGAMGMAGFMKRQNEFKGKNIGIIISGANMDFSRFSWIAKRAKVGLDTKRYFEIEIPERAGTMLELLHTISDLGLNIEDFNYGKVDEERAWPVFGFAGPHECLIKLEERLKEHKYVFHEVSNREDVIFRIVSYQPKLFKRPYFAIMEFPERPGALMEFMAGAGQWCNICYFNYTNRGELIGRALMGFEFDSDENRASFLTYLKNCNCHHTPVDLSALEGK